MAAVSTRKRLSPPFMHAFRSAHQKKDAKQALDLRDDSGERIIAARRAAGRAAISEPLLRREVAQDLEALVNAVALESTQDLTDFNCVRRSILNYGLPDLVHRTLDDAGVDLIEQEIVTALKLYEPRLAPGSIEATREATIDREEFKVRFLVRADLICTPVNVPVEFIADVDFDSGGVVVKKA